jgi:23S rRNA (uracil1939-C5)-methyltransferase
MTHPKSTTETVKISEIVPGGQGLGILADGRKVFVWGVLPDETAEIAITKNKKSYAEAFATKIIESNHNRIEPKDACYLSTSPWQIMNFDFELSQKAELVVKSFRQAKIELKTPEIVTDNNQWYYRNKMEYGLYWNNQTARIELALHQRGSHKKLAIETSSIEHPEIFAKATEIINDLNARHEEARKYQSLLLRSNQNGIVSGGLLENHQPHPVFSNLTDQICGKAYSYSPNGFFQINLPVYELALAEIAKYIEPNRKVLDLYSGVGTIGLSVSGDNELILVESNVSASKEAMKNAENRPNAEIITAKSEEVTGFITSDAQIILDPPRAGLDKKVIDKLLEAAPSKIIYLSCNPSTQARDVKMLSEKYQITHVKAFNFFPKTPHIENLIILEK